MRPAATALLLLVGLAGVSASAGVPTRPLDAWVWSDPQGDGDAAALLDGVAQLRLTHNHLDALGMVAFRADAATARQLHAAAGGRVDAVGAVDLHLDESVPFIGAEQVKRALGPVPDGPTVLVVDTGIDSGHPDFEPGRNLAANVQPVRVNGLAVGSDDRAPVVDEAGHGTHVAGVVAGSGKALGSQDELHGRYTGAYAVGRVASYKASSDEDGREAKVEVVAALEAFEWALDNQARYDIRVVTNSWGEPGEFDPGGPVAMATKRLYLQGMTVVFSAGNMGQSGPGHLNRFCVAPWVLCVAGGDFNQTVQDFSSRGTADPARPWDHPDLTAPGLFITSARPPSRGPLAKATVAETFAAPPSDSLYIDRSGTSTAAPHVAAAAALLQAGNPHLSPDQVMELLVGNARPMQDGLAAAGAGFLDVAAAYHEALRTPGERDAFLDGARVRYAGLDSGDPANAVDAVQGSSSSGGLEGRSERFWAGSPAGVVLLVLAASAVLAGTRSRVA